MKIVAEISANHLGDKARALELITVAAQAGADAVKFQLYDHEKISAPGLIEAGPWAGRDRRDLYREAMTPREWFPDLFSHAQALGLEAFSSVFDSDGLAYLQELGCPRYKIASFELVDLELISLVARAGRPMVISTGMATRDEVADAVLAIRTNQWHPEITVLKCTSGYPAPAHEANLATMAEMARFVGCSVGYSDHTVSAGVCAAASTLGAEMIEAHLTLRRSDGGPDAGFSYEPEEFKAMVKACLDAAAAIGEVRYGPTESERAQLPIRGRTLDTAPRAL